MILKIPQNSSFNLELAKKLLLLIEQAHKEFDKSQNEKNWNWDTDMNPIDLNGKKYKIKLRFGFAEYFYTFKKILNINITRLGDLGRERVPFGFIAHDEESNEVYVVFRGTMTPAEWITNTQFRPEHEPFLGKISLGKVHRGFHKIYTRQDIGPKLFSKEDDLPSIKDCIEKTIKAGLTENNSAQVYVTGHSLGGALATLATLHIKEINHFQKPPILYAFANPRAGGLEFSEQFAGLQCFRIANSEDIVPTLPLPSIRFTSNSNDTTSKSLNRTKLPLLSPLLPDLNYYHIGEPIYFTNHKESIAENHIIPAYKEALGIA